MIVKRVGLIGKGGRGAGGWGGGGHAPRNEESAKCLWRSFLFFKISAIYVQVLKLLRRMSLIGPFGMAPNSVRIQFRENLASKAAKAKAAIYITHMYINLNFYHNIISHFTKSKANMATGFQYF